MSQYRMTKENPLKVGLLTQWYDPEIGSAAIPGSIARSLQRLGHQVEVVTTFPNYPTGQIYDGYRQSRHKHEWLDSISVHRIPHIPYHGVGFIPRSICYTSFALSSVRMSRILSECDVILVYSTPVTVGLAASCNKWRYKTPVVTYVQDLWPETLTSSGMLRAGLASTPLHSLASAMSRAIYQSSDVIVTNSIGMQALMQSRLSKPTPIEVVPNWIDEALLGIAPDPNGFRSKWGLDEPHLITYAGNLGHAQDSLTLVKLAERLRNRKDVRLVVVGDGTLAPRMRTYAKELSLTNISFLGRLAPNEIPDAVAASTAQLVTLSADPLFSHTLPSKIQYSLALGKPIIASVEGDPRRVLTQSNAALVVAPGDVRALADSVIDLLSLPEATRQLMGLSARTYYQKFLSEEVGAVRLEQLLLGVTR